MNHLSGTKQASDAANALGQPTFKSLRTTEPTGSVRCNTSPTRIRQCQINKPTSRNTLCNSLNLGVGTSKTNNPYPSMTTSNVINRLMTSLTKLMTNQPGPRRDQPVLSYGQELGTGIQYQISMSQPTTHIDKLNRQLTKSKKPFTMTRMSDPPDVEHPNQNPPNKEKGPFANQKKASIKGRNLGLTVHLPAFLPICPLFGAPIEYESR